VVVRLDNMAAMATALSATQHREVVLRRVLCLVVLVLVAGVVWMHAVSGGHHAPAPLMDHSAGATADVPCDGHQATPCPHDPVDGHPGPLCQSGAVSTGTVPAAMPPLTGLAPPVPGDEALTATATVAAEAGSGSGCGPPSRTMLSISRT
jgi:hypothetical protein